MKNFIFYFQVSPFLCDFSHNLIYNFVPILSLCEWSVITIAAQEGIYTVSHDAQRAESVGNGRCVLCVRVYLA